MPQEMNVLCCYACKMYQVHIVKKAPKWNCKVCNAKQSVKQIYFQGSGRDCRLQVQQLNAMKANDTFLTPSGQDDAGGACDTFANISQESDSDSAAENKSTKYLESSEIEGFEDVEDLVYDNEVNDVTNDTESEDESEDVSNETKELRSISFNRNSCIDKCNIQENAKPNEDCNNAANIFETYNELDDPLDF